MSKFSDVAATSRALSLAAMEEASRYGQREADIDHLLLALTIDEGAAGQALRTQGVTLDAARTAVEEQHAEQLAALGVTTPAPEPGPIVFHETNGYSWTDRANDLFTRSLTGEKRGDAPAVLRELLDEPSGLIEQLLHRLGTTPADVIARLHTPTPAQQVTGKGAASRQKTEFIPAPVEQVWELLIDPRRMPDWHPTVSKVDYDGELASLLPGATWAAESDNKGREAKPVKGEPKWFHQVVTLTERSDHRLAAWRFTYRDAPQTNPSDLTVELEPGVGGTQLTVTLAIPSRRKTVLATMFGPVTRFMLGMRVSQITGEISRAFR